MRKLFTVLLAILTLLSLLCGCQSVNEGSSTAPSTPSIPTTVKPTTAPTTAPTTVPRPTSWDPLAVPSNITEEVIDAFYLRAGIEKSKDTQLCFFGVFDGIHAVLARDTANPGEPVWETVNGLTFYYPDGYGIMMGSGSNRHLWGQFTSGQITAEQLQVIYDNYYSAYPELLYLANGQFTFGPEEMEAISKALLPLTGEELGWDAVNSIGKPRLVYYCSIMGAHVFRWIPELHRALLTLTYLDVGPYRFGHIEEMQLYVYVGGELWTLAEAYDRGFFVDAQIEVISRFHGFAGTH